MGNKLVRKNTAVSSDIFGISSLERFLLPKRSKRNAVHHPAIIPGPWINPSGRCTPKIGSKKYIVVDQVTFDELTKCRIAPRCLIVQVDLIFTKSIFVLTVFCLDTVLGNTMKLE